MGSPVKPVRRPPISSLEQLIHDRPYAAQLVQTQIMYDLADMLESMLEELSQFRAEYNATIPEGRIEYVPLTVTDQETLLTRQDYPSMPWRSMEVYNVGPNTVYLYSYPESTEDFHMEKTPLLAGSTLRVDVKIPLIEKLAFVCDKGQTASLRISPVR